MAKYGPFNYERILGQRDYSMTAQITAFVADTQKRLTACALQSTSDLIDQVQTPVAKGGKMRVDTGFLRASGQASLTGMPTGPDRGTSGQQYTYAPVGIVQLAGDFTLGKTIYFGWSAAYAKYREVYDGFLISGIQNWQSIVDNVCKQISARSPANRGK